MGAKVAQFEREFADFTGSRHAVMVNSGSSANLLMIAALCFRRERPLQRGDEVIVPAVSWPTTYYPLQQYGLRLRFVDIDLETLNYDLDELESLTSTVMDYARFAHMLLNGGALDGDRVLGKKTVALMTNDQLSPTLNRGPFFLPGQSHGFGLLGAVRTEGPRAPAALNPMDGSVGEFYWAGYAGTYFWVDPKEELVGVYMMQSVKHLLWYATTFKTLVVQAVVE